MNTAFLISRGTHLAACLLIFGMDAFAIAVLSPMSTSTWRCRRRAILGWALPIMVMSGVAWFVLVTAGITDPPLTAAAMRFVWKRTHFGRLWQVRAVLAVATAAIQCFDAAKWFQLMSLLLSGALLASLAWAGHGQIGAWPKVHAANDCIHLLVAGFWPTGLVPLALLLRERSTSQADAVAITFRFSRMSVICVCALVLSGIINSLFTLRHPVDLINTQYGWLLLGKIAAATLMILIGALNRRAVRRGDPSLILRRVATEIGLSVVVIAATAWLGMLEP